ncbi:MAG TPA: MmcQ/YjbR family DNA-binding protein [Candidatus Limnocylindria bacterium]
MSLFEEIRAFAFGLPEAWEDHPWGESVAKVGKKVFVFFGEEQPADGALRFTVKLPDSHDEALSLSFTQTPGYGLDRGHWVTVTAPPDAPPEMLTAWVEESYRAVAPRALVKAMDG